MADELRLSIDLDTSPVKSGFKDLERQGDSTASFIGSKFKSLAVGIGSAFAAVKIVNFFQNAAQEAGQAEKATNALSAALAQIGKFSPQAVGSFNEFATTLQRTTGIQDDLIKQNAALLVSLGNLSGQALEQATTASLNLAQALQIDVGTAFDLVAKASTGNVTALSRYGIRIDENIPKTEKFAAVLGLIEQRFNGLAQTRLNTFEGSLENLANAFGEIQEAIGGFIVNSPALRAVINVVSQSLFDLAESISGLAGGDPFGRLISGALEFGKVLTAFVIAPVEKFINVTVLGVQTLVTAFQGLIALFGQVQGAIVENLIRPVIDGFGFIADKVIGLFNEELASKVKSNIEGFGAAIGETSQTVADSTAEVFNDSFNSLAESADKAFNADISQSIFSYLDKLQIAADTTTSKTSDIKNSLATIPEAVEQPLLTVGALFNNFTSGFESALTDFTKNAVKNFQEIGKQAFNTLGRGVGQAFAAFGQALASGEDAGKAFLQSLLGIFADIAIQLGTSYILQGIAASANPLTPGIGGPLIAAGAGLATFGGILKGLAGGKSQTSQQAVGGGGVAAEPSPATEIAQPEQIERAEPQTAVQLIVQGDIFDSDSTATRLTDLLNEAFDKKGVVIQRGAFA